MAPALAPHLTTPYPRILARAVGGYRNREEEDGEPPDLWRPLERLLRPPGLWRTSRGGVEFVRRVDWSSRYEELTGVRELHNSGGAA
ncbi:hypothetical protein LIER_12538 [Lithospermum erythrorhizon]|uniref:Uncharacterized protein n=1 Tax=Lithospermum erythrorhizon TaxID=34254 RepID=A0AAV3PU44_LITER